MPLTLCASQIKALANITGREIHIYLVERNKRDGMPTVVEPPQRDGGIYKPDAPNGKPPIRLCLVDGQHYGALLTAADFTAVTAATAAIASGDAASKAAFEEDSIEIDQVRIIHWQMEILTGASQDPDTEATYADLGAMLAALGEPLSPGAGPVSHPVLFHLKTFA